MERRLPDQKPILEIAEAFSRRIAHVANVHDMRLAPASQMNLGTCLAHSIRSPDQRRYGGLFAIASDDKKDSA